MYTPKYRIWYYEYWYCGTVLEYFVYYSCMGSAEYR